MKNCPNCGSTKLVEYKKDSLLGTVHHSRRYKCSNCGKDIEVGWTAEKVNISYKL